MTRKQRRYSPISIFALRFFILTFGFLWLTGALWVLIQFSKSEPADYRTSVQTLLMQSHGAIAFLALMSLGSFARHVKEGFAVKVNVRSGLAMLIVMAILIITAWLLYYAGEESVRHIASLLHWIIGVSLLFLLIAHGTLGKKLLRRKTLTSPFK